MTHASPEFAEHRQSCDTHQQIHQHGQEPPLSAQQTHRAEYAEGLHGKRNEGRNGYPGANRN
ncbi:hypothetical protein SDC9_112994 [bioreactor metagenome]|uniref:Uncharacterized protein n=1 Tax=bioreactor metagenome TaxID=1076179 RepID=A0A645BLH8_9ZZZZ